MTIAELESTDPETAASIRRRVEQLQAIVAQQRADLDDQEAGQ